MKDKLMRIKMLKSKHGSPDGVSVNHYEAGKEYDLPESLAQVFIDTDKVAEAAGEKAEPALDNKADKAPKNKADKVA